MYPDVGKRGPDGIAHFCLSSPLHSRTFSLDAFSLWAVSYFSNLTSKLITPLLITHRIHIFPVRYARLDATNPSMCKEKEMTMCKTNPHIPPTVPSFLHAASSSPNWMCKQLLLPTKAATNVAQMQTHCVLWWATRTRTLVHGNSPKLHWEPPMHCCSVTSKCGTWSTPAGTPHECGTFGTYSMT